MDGATCAAVCPAPRGFASTANRHLNHPPTAQPPAAAIPPPRCRLDSARLPLPRLPAPDRSYQHFCRCGRSLDARLEALGGARLAPRVDVNREDWKAIDGWLEGVLAGLAALPLKTVEQLGGLGKAAGAGDGGAHAKRWAALRRPFCQAPRESGDHPCSPSAASMCAILHLVTHAWANPCRPPSRPAPRAPGPLPKRPSPLPTRLPCRQVE